MEQPNILTASPVAPRLGAPLIVILAGVTAVTASAAIWLGAVPPTWASVAGFATALIIVLLAGYFNTRPSRVKQPPWAKRFVIVALSAAILVPLLALFPAVSAPAIGVWIMGAIAVAEGLLLAVVIGMVVTHRELSASPRNGH